MTEEKLRNCPFCGKEPVCVADGKVLCVCGAMIKSFNDWKPFTNQEAVDRWNKRVVDANKTITCFKCHGKGTYKVIDPDYSWNEHIQLQCEICKGTGKITLEAYEWFQGEMRDKE